MGGGYLHKEIRLLGESAAREPLHPRKALYLMWSCGISFSCWRIKNRIEGRVGIDPGERKMLQTSKTLQIQARDLVGIHSNTTNDISGTMVDVMKAIRLLCAELESKGMDINDLPATMRFRFTLDGTILTNGVSIVVVGLVPINLPASCQSRDNVVLVAILKCGENGGEMVDALDGVYNSISMLGERGFHFHGLRKFEVTQSHDNATYWKLAGQTWNSREGCCWVCKANKGNLHLYEAWQQATVVGQSSDHLKGPALLSMSGYCVLHFELRVFTDSYLNNLAFEAWVLGNQKKLEGKIQELTKSSHFYIEKDAGGWVSTSALQGPQSRKLRSDIPAIVDAAGIGDSVANLKHKQISKDALAKQCRAITKKGERCQKKICAESKNKLCTTHMKQDEEYDDILLSKVNDNLVLQGTPNNRNKDYKELGDVLDKLFKATQQLYPYYDNQYEIEIVTEYKNSNTKKQIVPMCGTHLQTLDGVVYGDGNWPNVGDTVSVIACHFDHKVRKKKATVVKFVATASEMMEELERLTTRLAVLWTNLFGDERWSMYVHHAVCHTKMLMEIHKYLGQFSNSVLESFHKVVRWFYQHTNREGGKLKVESCDAVMLKFYGLKILEIEERGTYSKEMVHSLISNPERVDCNCSVGGICGWGKAVKRKPQQDIIDLCQDCS